jgi:hypothetical protein
MPFPPVKTGPQARKSSSDPDPRYKSQAFPLTVVVARKMLMVSSVTKQNATNPKTVPLYRINTEDSIHCAVVEVQFSMQIATYALPPLPPPPLFKKGTCSKKNLHLSPRH